MKAIVYEKYGSPDVLELREIQKPTPKDDEVLVKVHAASINDWDWGFLQGKPFINRLLSGLRRPKVQILGCDIAGRIEAVGKNIKQLKPGDEVFGDLCECGFGGFAEYVCGRENALTLKPAAISFEEAAAIPQAAVLALRGLRDYVQIKKGQKLLINGAGGGAGSFTVQIAKLLGAEVTGVDSIEKLDIMRSIGADHVIDYTKEDFTKNGQQYDLILDHAAYHSISDYKRALSPKGTYIIVGGSMALVFQIMFIGPWISMIGSLPGRKEGKKMRIQGHKPNKDLDLILEFIEAGKIEPVIDKRYPLSEAAEALRYFGAGHTKGKVVITVEQNSNS